MIACIVQYSVCSESSQRLTENVKKFSVTLHCILHFLRVCRKRLLLKNNITTLWIQTCSHSGSWCQSSLAFSTSSVFRRSAGLLSKHPSLPPSDSLLLFHFPDLPTWPISMLLLWSGEEAREPKVSQSWDGEHCHGLNCSNHKTNLSLSWEH